MRKQSVAGFTYIGLLIFIALAGVGLSLVGVTWQQQVRAEKEKQLLFVGNEYRKALKSYYEAAPNGIKVYPQTFKDLLLDNRFPTVRRHLRRLYPDPMTGKDEWGLYRNQGRITAIFTLSDQKPFKVARFPKENLGFEGAQTYQAWVFGQANGQRETTVLNATDFAASQSAKANQGSGYSVIGQAQTAASTQNTTQSSGTNVSGSTNGTNESASSSGNQIDLNSGNSVGGHANPKHHGARY